MLNNHFDKYKTKYQYIAGVDEAGRGPLAGPVVAAAVIFDNHSELINHELLTDSKKLTEKKRERAYDLIINNCLAYSFGFASEQEIDNINIFQASLLAMKRALDRLDIPADIALIDGKFAPKNLSMPAVPIIKGDLYETVISAASILAKVKRDALMLELDKLHPEYGFAKHKGYPTKYHIDCLKKHGVTKYHRQSFGPVKNLLVSLTSK